MGIVIAAATLIS